MVDALRSRIMRSVPQKKTKPEMVVRRALHAAGYRFRTNLRSLPGSPDIAFTAKRKVIFIHGCFWHRHVGCKFSTIPKQNNEFWQSKFDANVRRDQHNILELTKLSWQVEVVWQCETNDMDRLLHRLAKFLGPAKETAQGQVGPPRLGISAVGRGTQPDEAAGKGGLCGVGGSRPLRSKKLCGFA